MLVFKPINLLLTSVKRCNVVMGQEKNEVAVPAIFVATHQDVKKKDHLKFPLHLDEG